MDDLTEPTSAHSSFFSLSPSSSPPSSPSPTDRSRPQLPRIHFSRHCQCSIQAARYSDFLQRRSVMKSATPAECAVSEYDNGRVQRSLISEFEGAEETTEEEASSEENRSDGCGSDSERERSSIVAQTAGGWPLLSTVKERRALSAASSSSQSASSASASVSPYQRSNVASLESLEKEMPLLMDTLFGEDEEATAERRNRLRVAPTLLPPPPLSPVAITYPSPHITPVRQPTTLPSSPTAHKAHFVFRSPASPTSASSPASPYPALASAARVSITPAPRQTVSTSEQQGTGGRGSGQSFKKSSFFSFGKKASSTTAASSPILSVPSSPTPSPHSAISASTPSSLHTSYSAVAPSSTSPFTVAVSARREVIVRSSYLLTAVDSKLSKPGHTFLCLDLTPSRSAAPGLQVVEDERVVRHIELPAITRCSVGMDDVHVVNIMYATRRAGSRIESSDRVEFRLASLLDAQHVLAIVNAVIARKTTADTASTAPVSPSSARSTLSSSQTSPPPSPLSTSSPVSPSTGQACLHQGWLVLYYSADKDSPWQSRFGRLYSTRLILYRTASSSLPLHVYPLVVDPAAAKRSSVHTNHYQHIIVDLVSEQSGQRFITLRCDAPEELNRWTEALTALLGTERTDSATPTVVESSTNMRAASSSSPLLDRSLSSTSTTAGSVKSLAPLLSSQRAFMSYVFEVSTLSPFFPSTLPSCASFTLQTPPTFLRRRHPSLAAVECELDKYEQLVSSLSYLWNETRLVMVDELEQSGSGQIGFAYPGFDGQVFDVGRLSVVCSGQLLPAPSLDAPHPLTFTQQDYHSAIDSSSPMKELMTQASPDLTDMFNSASPSTRHAAKLLSAQSQRLLLHHCTIASHMKAEWSKWRSGDRVSWSTMSAASSAVKLNERALACYADVEYVWNPSLGALHRCIQAVKATHRTGAVISAMSLPPLQTLAEPNNPVTAGLPVGIVREATASPSSHSSATNVASTPTKLSLFGLSRGKSSSVEATATSSPATPLSPTSPTFSSPSAPLSPTTSSSASAMEVRCLVDSIHLVFLLRTLLHYRRHALSTLHSSLLPAFAAHTRDNTVTAVLSSLVTAVERERDDVVRVLSVLPSQAEIEREDKRQRRERKERRRQAEKRREAMEEKRREELLHQHLMDAKQQMLSEWEADRSHSGNVHYFYNTDSGTSGTLDTTADGVAMEQSVADLVEVDRELPQLLSECLSE